MSEDTGSGPKERVEHVGSSPRRLPLTFSYRDASVDGSPKQASPSAWLAQPSATGRLGKSLFDRSPTKGGYGSTSPSSMRTGSSLSGSLFNRAGSSLGGSLFDNKSNLLDKLSEETRASSPIASAPSTSRLGVSLFGDKYGQALDRGSSAPATQSSFASLMKKAKSSERPSSPSSASRPSIASRVFDNPGVRTSPGRSTGDPTSPTLSNILSPGARGSPSKLSPGATAATSHHVKPSLFGSSLRSRPASAATSLFESARQSSPLRSPSKQSPAAPSRPASAGSPRAWEPLSLGAGATPRRSSPSPSPQKGAAGGGAASGSGFAYTPGFFSNSSQVLSGVAGALRSPSPSRHAATSLFAHAGAAEQIQGRLQTGLGKPASPLRRPTSALAGSSPGARGRPSGFNRPWSSTALALTTSSGSGVGLSRGRQLLSRSLSEWSQDGAGTKAETRPPSAGFGKSSASFYQALPAAKHSVKFGGLGDGNDYYTFAKPTAAGKAGSSSAGVLKSALKSPQGFKGGSLFSSRVPSDSMSITGSKPLKWPSTEQEVPANPQEFAELDNEVKQYKRRELEIAYKVEQLQAQLRVAQEEYADARRQTARAQSMMHQGEKSSGGGRLGNQLR